MKKRDELSIYCTPALRRDQISKDRLQYLDIKLLAGNQAVIQKEKGWSESE